MTNAYILGAGGLAKEVYFLIKNHPSDYNFLDLNLYVEKLRKLPIYKVVLVLFFDNSKLFYKY